MSWLRINSASNSTKIHLPNTFVTMAADPLETYTHYPLQIDPASKTISLSNTASLPNSNVSSSLTSLNLLHTALKTLDTPSNVPPPPLSVNPKRSAQVNKLRDAALAAHRKAQYAEAVRLWGYAIDMASSRPSWEPVGLVREELAALFRGRAESEIAQSHWVEGWKDAESSVECRAGVPPNIPPGQQVPGNKRAWVLGSRCLTEMGRRDSALGWLEKGVNVEGTDGDEGKELLRCLGEARRQVEKGGFKRVQ